MRGSGNVFRDLGQSDADVQQAKALLAAQVISVLDEEGLSTRKAEALTGINHADFTRIRNTQLGRFTIDRLMTVLNKLGHQVEVHVTVQPRRVRGSAPAQPSA